MTSSKRLVLPAIRFDPDSFQKIFADVMLQEENRKTGTQSEWINDQVLVGYESQGKDEDLENRPDKTDCVQICIASRHLPDFYGRRDRAILARHFTNRYKFALGEKICIHPYGPTIACLSDSCLESPWVGVHGMQSMCIVTRRDMFECEEDMKCLSPFYQRDSMKQQNMEMFAGAAISEVECLPHEDVDYYDVAFRELCTGTVKKPFAVVCPGQSALEEFGYEGSKPLRCWVLKTIEYLESVVPSELVNTHYGILRVAIKAYQLLMCHKELRADDIWVTIMEDVEPNCFEHLPIDKIGDQLDIVNGLSSGKDPQKPILKYCGSLQ